MMKLISHKSIYNALGAPNDNWGFIIFRTAFDPGYDDKFLQALKILDDRVHHHAYASWDKSKATPERSQMLGDKVMAKYQNLIFDDEKTFGNASVQALCHHLFAWMYELDEPEEGYKDSSYSDTRLLVFDAECIDTILGWSSMDGDLPLTCAGPWMNIVSRHLRNTGNARYTVQVRIYMRDWGQMMSFQRGGALTDWYNAHVQDMAYGSKD